MLPNDIARQKFVVVEVYGCRTIDVEQALGLKKQNSTTLFNGLLKVQTIFVFFLIIIIFMLKLSSINIVCNNIWLQGYKT